MKTNELIPGQSVADTLSLMLLAALALPAAGLAVLSRWATVVSWAVDHSLLVDAAQNPIVVLPASAGAGLDVGRLVFVLIVAASLLGGLWRLWRMLRRARRERLARRGLV